MKRWDRDMQKCDLNIIILGRDLHKNEVSFIFENFNPNPTLKGTLYPNPNPNPNPNVWSI
jgi:hypothetical protein